MSNLSVLLSCEHGGNQVPTPFRALFRDAGAALNSHRGWDPGAAKLTHVLADRLQAPAYVATVTRLLVDLNRSPTNPRRFSTWTTALAQPEKSAIMQAYYYPWRQTVEQALLDAMAQHDRVLHLSIHSFTPVLGTQVRRCDLGLLYDPKHASEKAFANAVARDMGQRMPDLRVRRNYPYTGIQDGFVARLRRQWSAQQYIGLELETNQALYDRGDLSWVAQMAEVLASSIACYGESWL